MSRTGSRSLKSPRPKRHSRILFSSCARLRPRSLHRHPFARIVNRYRGDAGVRTLGCADLLRVMAFAQPTWREPVESIRFLTKRW
nr:MULTISPECIES: DUF4372 domain-containing protein [Cupriavidus]